MLVERVIATKAVVPPIEADVRDWQAVDDLRKGEESEFRSQDILQRTSEYDIVLWRDPILQCDTLAVIQASCLPLLGGDPLHLFFCEPSPCFQYA